MCHSEDMKFIGKVDPSLDHFLSYRSNNIFGTVEFYPNIYWSLSRDLHLSFTNNSVDNAAA